MPTVVETDPAFCFMLVVWGERYRRYFTDYCLPSLLAPNNIPCIRNKRDSRFAIATTAEDWNELNNTEVFTLLKNYIEPVLLELPPFSAGDPKMLVMSGGHKRLSNYAFERQMVGVNINPDSIYSDQTIHALQGSVSSGVKIAIYPGVRFEFEGVVSELRQRGLLENPSVITIPPRVAAGIGIRNPHPFTIACNWDSDRFFHFPVYYYLTNPAKTVMVLHTISMGPIMLNYRAISDHKDEIFDNWTLDGDYAHSNFGHFDIHREIEYIDDSDTFMVLGFTPKDEDAIEPPRLRGGRILQSVSKGRYLWAVFSNPVADPLKQRVFLRQVFIHEGDHNKDWDLLAARDQGILKAFVLPLISDDDLLAYDLAYNKNYRPRSRNQKLMQAAKVRGCDYFCQTAYGLGKKADGLFMKTSYLWLKTLYRWRDIVIFFDRLRGYCRVIILAMMLDQTEIERIRKRIKIIMRLVLRSRSAP